MGLNLNLQLPTADLMQKQANQQYLALLNKTNFANFMGSQLTGLISDGIGDAFGNSGIGRQVGNVFGNGLGSVGGTMLSNYLKGNTLMQGVSKNLGASLQGAASGLAADFAGRGINALIGDSKLGNFAGGATSSALGLILGGGIGNPITFGANVLGSGLSSMLGPSKEYGGKYGNITLTMDSVYGAVQGAAGLFGPVGMGVSAGMALNKGLSNLFGSTDAMTKQDAILGSAFMPAPVKWLNAGLGKKTGSFDNLSWQNQEKANSFMQNGFGDLGERFDLARYEANKKYGLFSQHARRKAQRNIDFANVAWDLVLAMADQNELQNIRSLYMSSINNLRYAQMLGGGLKPLLIGKQGMKILNNQTNHNMGLRLLSAAALIDNKAMILSAQGGTKLTRLRPKPLPKKPATREENPELWDEWERRESEQLAARLQVYDLERQAATQRAETNARHALHYSNLATGVAETAQQNALFEPVTQESLQNSNTEQLRLEQLADKNEYFDNGMKFINATGFADLGVNVAAPLLQRGFRWAFNKAGLLIRVPITLEVELFPKGLTSNEPLIAAGKIENNLTSHLQGEEAVKMFKEYGGTPIPEGSINGELLRKYVAEARERYGLVGNNNITDEEIAQALYKHTKELGGNTAAVNAQGEPLLLFRGDTLRYTLLKERMSPGELATKKGTMDNSLGNLFLGEFPNSWRGVDRYIGTWRNFNGDLRLIGSGTGSKVVWNGKIASEIEGVPLIGPKYGGGYKLYTTPMRYGNIDVYKLPASMMESGVNDLNAFVVRTPQMRNASNEISVLNDDWMLQGAKGSHFMSKNYKYNPKTYSMENVRTGESLGEITTESAPESRAAIGDHYKELLKEAEQKQQGLLKSEANSSLRDEHDQYSYFALPNFNIRNAKHLLPYDLRIPRDWTNPNVYKAVTPYIVGGSTAATLYNKSK